jgi:hypothetical protein
LNEQKIDFIVAYNNERTFGECLFYLDKLAVPEGYEMGLLSINDGESMTGAYNEAMQASTAKYKVYLHQDVFILNRNFISDILAVFQSDATIGMIGVLGGVNLPRNGIFFNTWNVGRVKADGAAGVVEIDWNPPESGAAVEAIDGMIMITQYDLPWREDLFQGWDFYDASQSFEFRNQGYKIVVPYQKEAWCLHDCGASKLHNYEESRLIFVKEYIKDCGAAELKEYGANQEEKAKRLSGIKERLVRLFAQKEFAEIYAILQPIDDKDLPNTELRYEERLGNQPLGKRGRRARLCAIC